MSTAEELVSEAVTGGCGPDVPSRVKDIADRHHQNLIDLANALMRAGRNEDEVIRILEQASESFARKLDESTKALQL